MTPTFWVDARIVRARAWWFFLLLMAPVVGVYLFGPAICNSGPVFNAIGLTGVAAILVGVRWHRPRSSVPWYLFAAGQTLFVSGDVLAYNYRRFFGHELPFPSIADAFYLAVGPTTVLGLVLLIRQVRRKKDWSGLIDALIVAIAAGLVSWIFLISPYVDDATLSLPVKLTSIAYPMMDLLMLSAALRLAFGGIRSKASMLTVASIGALFATDMVYGWLQLHGGYLTGGLLDGGWIAFYLLFGAAALHPSMAAPEQAPARVRLTRTRLAALTAAACIAPVTGVLGASAWDDRLLTAGSAIVLFVLVLVRMSGVVRQQESSAARERSLEETTVRLQELDRLKDQFVATVSHELRTPLTSINGYLELIIEGDELSDEHRQYLAVVDRNTRRLRRLVEDLLLVSELDAGKLALHLGELDLRALAEEAVESSRPAAEELGISLDFTADGAVAATGDGLRIAQVFDNVISNALKFTPRGGTVSVRMVRSNGSAVLEVEDTGIGIAADEQPQLFDRFFRARSADVNAVQGTGLGLSISQAIAVAHGGLIDVSSEESVGTTFRVALPALS